MSYSSTLLLKAYKELIEAWGWYEDKQPGLGDRFKEEVYKNIQKIEFHPERYPVRKIPYHECRIDIFPYLIIYRIKKKDKLIVIVSIFHAKRNPNKKYSNR